MTESEKMYELEMRHDGWMATFDPMMELWMTALSRILVCGPRRVREPTVHVRERTVERLT